jgi:hypothetical protein
VVLAEELSLPEEECIMPLKSFLTQTLSAMRLTSPWVLGVKKLSFKDMEMSDIILPKKCMKKEPKL